MSKIKAKGVPQKRDEPCPFRKVGEKGKTECDISNKLCPLFLKGNVVAARRKCTVFEEGGEETLEEYKRRVYMYDSMGDGGVRDYMRNETLYERGKYEN